MTAIKIDAKNNKKKKKRREIAERIAATMPRRCMRRAYHR